MRLKFRENGRVIRETTGTMNEVKARRMLRLSEGDVERGIPSSPKKDRITFEEGVEHLTADSQVKRRKSQDQLERRIRSGSDRADAARLLDQKSGHPVGHTRTKIEAKVPGVADRDRQISWEEVGGAVRV